MDGQTNSGDQDAFVTKYLPDGTKSWTRLLGSDSDEFATSITTGADGAMYVSGWTRGNLDGQTNSGDTDAFITKYLPDGTKSWTRLLGSEFHEYSLGTTTSADGSIYVSGATDGNLDGQINRSGSDAFITKYLPDGTRSWTRLLESEIGMAGASSMTTGADGSIYVSGATYGNLDDQTNSGGWDVFTTKYMSDGTKSWSRLLGSASLDEATSMTTGADGSIYVSGYTEGNLDGQINSGGRDAFITKYLPDGTKSWTLLLGTDAEDQANSMIAGADGSIYVSG